MNYEGNKKLIEIKAEVVALLTRLSGGSPKKWLDRQIEIAKNNPDRDVETLRMIRAALKDATSGPENAE